MSCVKKENNVLNGAQKVQKTIKEEKKILTIRAEVIY